MKIHSLTYVGLYDDDSFRVVTKVALSYKEACQVNYPRMNVGASGFTEDITSTVLHRLKIG